MVTKSEMKGIQGWFLKRLGCFSINQLSPSTSTLRYAVELIEKGEQLVVFPEGKINKYGKKLVLKEGLYRLARLATKKTTSITIIPIGIAYSKIPPNFRGEFCLSLGQPIAINDCLDLTINEFNIFLNKKMIKEEEKALKKVILKEDIDQIKIQKISRKLAKEIISTQFERKKCLTNIMNDNRIDQLIKDNQIKKAEKRAIEIIKKWK